MKRVFFQKLQKLLLKQKKGSHLEDQVVLEDKVCDACYEDEEGREDSAPEEDDAVWLWQLHQVGYLEACDVIDRKQSQQSLQAMRASP